MVERWLSPESSLACGRYKNARCRSVRELRPLFDIPGEIRVFDIILFGPPAARPYKRNRKALGEFGFRDRYDRRQFMIDAELSNG